MNIPDRALHKYWNSKDKMALVSCGSQDIYKYDQKMNMRQTYRMSHFIISHFNTFYQIKRTALLVFIHSLMWAEVLGQLNNEADIKD